MAARRVGEAELADSHRVRLAYWASFGEYLREKNSAFESRKPKKSHSRGFAIGRAGSDQCGISTDNAASGSSSLSG